MLAELRAALAPDGLNLVGAAAVAEYDSLLASEHALARRFPEAVTAIVVGNGGGAFWRAFRAACAGSPALAADPDPLDRFTEACVDQAVRRVAGGVSCRVLYPFRFASEPVSFLRLAAVAGLGTAGRVGVLLHPEYGPWIAFRAAVLVPFAVDAPRPAEGFDPCPGCVERACMPACPAGAVSDDGWDIPRCAAYRAREADGCAAGCHARVACVIGRAHRYPADALAHHQRRAKPALAAWAARARR